MFLGLDFPMVTIGLKLRKCHYENCTSFCVKSCRKIEFVASNKKYRLYFLLIAEILIPFTQIFTPHYSNIYFPLLRYLLPVAEIFTFRC